MFWVINIILKFKIYFLAIKFILLATDMLSSPILTQQKGSFIGYSSVGNPLYRYTLKIFFKKKKYFYLALKLV